MTILSYLRFSLTADADLVAFDRDMREMLALGERQPGHRWTEMGPSMMDPSVYVVVSEWDTVDQVRAWEHVPEHEAVAKVWEPFYREPLVHSRFTPWIRPEGT